MSDIMNDFVETNSYQIPGKGEFTEIAEPWTWRRWREWDLNMLPEYYSVFYNNVEVWKIWW